MGRKTFLSLGPRESQVAPGLCFDAPMVLTLLVALGLGSAPQPARAARLLAPSPPPLGLQPAEQSDRTALLRAEIASLNGRIAAIDVNWPTGAVLLVATGGIMLYVVTVLGATTSSLVTGALLAVTLSLAIGAAALLVAGLVLGATSTASARADRAVLIEEREALERELKRLEATPSLVHLGPAPRRITVATF